MHEPTPDTYEGCQAMVWNVASCLRGNTIPKGEDALRTIRWILETSEGCNRLETDRGHGEIFMMQARLRALRGRFTKNVEARRRGGIEEIKAFTQDPALREIAQEVVLDERRDARVLCKAMMPWHWRVYYDVECLFSD